VSKKFRNKLCVYCLSNPSTTTGDHVFAREFFVHDKRGNLPKVPACEWCNNIKSQLEHYLTAVLPFGGRHGDATVALTEMAPNRLARNAKLHRELAEWREASRSKESEGTSRPTLTIPFDGSVLEHLFDFIVRGLVYFHWGTTLDEQYGVRLITLTRTGEHAMSYIFSMNARQHVNVNLGDGTFCYEGKQSDYPQLTAWRFLIHGGMTMAGDPNAPDEEARVIGAVTGSKEFLKRKAITDVFGEEPAFKQEV
jgi:hypothetical protein